SVGAARLCIFQRARPARVRGRTAVDLDATGTRRGRRHLSPSPREIAGRTTRLIELADLRAAEEQAGPLTASRQLVHAGANVGMRSTTHAHGPPAWSCPRPRRPPRARRAYGASSSRTTCLTTSRVERRWMCSRSASLIDV